MKIQDITFDQDDKTLFLIDDLQLKADAIRYSILPKLEIINNELISRLTNLYSFNFFDNYSVGKSPHFRLAKTQRKEPTKTNYQEASISITGQRKDNKWIGLDKGKGIVPKISPISIGIGLMSEGIYVGFVFNRPANFTKETYKNFYDFFIDEIHNIIGLSVKAKMNYRFQFLDVFSILEDLKSKLEAEKYDFILFSKPIDYPINYEIINDILYSYILLFPVLNACIEIALGNKPDLKKDLRVLEEKLMDYLLTHFDDNEDIASTNEILEEDLQAIKLRAESKIKVQAGVRWQVFKRDNWRCVSCGRSADDNIILHIDHILPRSKGGKDEIENYQTLCETCNIGKSNKDDTDLRKK